MLGTELDARGEVGRQAGREDRVRAEDFVAGAHDFDEVGEEADGFGVVGVPGGGGAAVGKVKG